jgi:hypothetical protein
MVYGLKHTFPGVNVLQASSAGCRPVAGGTGEPRCLALMKSIFEDFVPAHRLDAIILSGRWRANEAEAVASTVALLKPHARAVIVLGPRVLYRSPLPRLLAMQIIERDPGLADRARNADQKAVDQLLAKKLKGTGAQYVSIYKAICPQDDRCRTTDSSGRPLQFDYGHFTPFGSVFVANKLKTSIDFRLARRSGD